MNSWFESNLDDHLKALSDHWNREDERRNWKSRSIPLDGRSVMVSIRILLILFRLHESGFRINHYDATHHTVFLDHLNDMSAGELLNNIAEVMGKDMESALYKPSGIEVKIRGGL